MGCDIHGVFQVKYSDGKWRTEDKIENDRNYKLFAILANVRNGFEFAGIKTNEPIPHIQEQRGLPKDFKVDDNYGETHEWRGEEIWMGDHSYGWLNFDEIFNYPNWDQKLAETGILSKEEYEKWDKVSCPESWCGGRMGPDVIVVSSPEEDPNWTDIRVHWESRTLREICNVFLKWIEYLDAKYSCPRENKRIVFGFDS